MTAKKQILKRITVQVNEDLDIIQARIKKDTGIDMSYVQLINFLIHFYKQKANEPATRWKSLDALRPDN